MNVTLHLAISQDGFIAKSDGDSSWVSAVDEELFKDRVKKAGCTVVGKTTFEQYQGTIYPVRGALNVVLTSDPMESQEPEVVYVATPQEALKVAEDYGCAGILVAGGAKTAETFLREGLVNEIFLSVHPIELHEGIKPADDLLYDAAFKLVGEKNLTEGVIERHFAMI